jgi:hypothetical protein
MTDEIIENLLNNIRTTIKPSGIVIIKEHDCTSREDQFIIDWEHHLYHLMMTNDTSIKDLENYTTSFTSNYKSKASFDELFARYNFAPVIELNRFFKEADTQIDIKNVTNLYWKVYKPMF